MRYVESAKVCNHFETVRTINTIDSVNLAGWKCWIIDQGYKCIGFTTGEYDIHDPTYTNFGNQLRESTGEDSFISGLRVNTIDDPCLCIRNKQIITRTRRAAEADSQAVHQPPWHRGFVHVFVFVTSN